MAADVPRQPADDNSLDTAPPQHCGGNRMLRGERKCLQVTGVALAPDRVKAIRHQSRKKLGCGRSHDAVWRIQVVTLATETTVIGRMPVLAGVDASPLHPQKTIDQRHNLKSTRYRQFIGIQSGKALLHI